MTIQFAIGGQLIYYLQYRKENIIPLFIHFVKSINASLISYKDSKSCLAFASLEVLPQPKIRKTIIIKSTYKIVVNNVNMQKLYQLVNNSYLLELDSSKLLIKILALGFRAELELMTSAEM